MAMLSRLAASFAMSDPVWERHANPWSGWTRLPILPLLTLALYARAWIGPWCLVPVALLLLWSWANPRAFPPPRHTTSWFSRATLGERVWLNAGEVPIPPHHARAASLLSTAATLALVPLAWGLWTLDPAWTVLGLALAVMLKLWLLDRMVWLHHDMAAHHRPYADWLR
ncbi:DUF6653 family protein [Oceaniglobus roseus]|uniref:DUF6653 family protein n=1 Tax=Oceaniglobus roseus TaxID=1737570 RepID=UPI000C7F797E|nr:DUF6653 family protein [Kandeliimicrobium roseum]